MLSHFLTFGSASLSVLGAIAILVTIAQGVEARRIQRVRRYPKRLFFRIRGTTLWREIEAVRSRYSNSLPDVVAGVHHGGMTYAAKFSRKFNVPLVMVTTQLSYANPDGPARCTAAICQSPGLVDGKSVWLIDNQIWSGRTLRLAKEELLRQGAESVFTVVIHKNGFGEPTDPWPDLTLFHSRRKLRHLLL